MGCLTMDWQQIASLGIVALTALLLLRKGFGNRPGGAKKCNGGCHCGEAGKEPVDSY
ncbi:MAG: hypothetical protein OEV30_10845 [Ignavibacteria bacterium]|nr:hypothetical protein [Ignavibacteria bacterium]